MTLFELLGTISIDNSDANKSLNETSDSGQKAESKLGKAFKSIGNGAVAVGKTIAAGMAVGATAVGALVTKSVQSYADYEQLVGGVDTLFKDASAKVQEYAEDAYKTAGLSANEYMETVTSFSASLLQSLGGDTAKAADYAHMAITDMSDNANKMGTDMTLIQNAYNGFAKANYTMLDNLKLGYGGTQAEMQRLLEDAQAISGIEYDISSYADVVDAIHVIQTEMGITGTTAKEASSTISGSIASMKSSWQNLLTAISSDDLPFDEYVQNFVDSVATVADNLMPRLQVALTGAVNLVKQLAPVIGDAIPELLSTLLPALTSAATSLVGAIVSAIPDILDGILSAVPDLLQGIMDLFSAFVDALPDLFTMIVEALPDLISQIVGTLPTLIPTLISGITEMIVTLCNNLTSIIEPIIKAIPDILKSIVDSLIKNLPLLIQGLTTLITELVNMLAENLPIILDGIVSVIQMIVEALPELVPMLLDAIVQLITLIVEQIPVILPALLEAIVSIITMLGDMLPELIPVLVEALVSIIYLLIDQLPIIIPMLIDACITIIMAIIEALPDILQALLEALPVILQAVWDAIVMVFMNLPAWFGQIFQGAVEIIKAVFWVIVDFFANLWGTIKEIFAPVAEWFGKIFSAAWEGIKKAWSAVVNFFAGIWDGIKNAFSAVGTWFKDIFTGAWEGIKNVFAPVGEFFSGIWTSIKNAFGSVADWFKDIFSKAWEAVKNVFSATGEVFLNIGTGILDALKIVVNAIIKGLNTVIALPFKGLNGILDTIHDLDILGVEPFSWLTWRAPVPQIPQLAEGGVVDEPTPAVFGEDGAEAVVPLENNTGWLNKVAKQLHEFEIETKHDISGALSTRSIELQEDQLSEMQLLNNKVDNIITMMVQFFPDMLEAMNVQMYLDTGVLVAESAPAMDAELGKIAIMKGRGMG